MGAAAAAVGAVGEEDVEEVHDMEAVGEVDMGAVTVPLVTVPLLTVPLVAGFPDKWGRVAAALVLAMVPRASCRPTVTSFISRQQRNLAVVSVASVAVACDRVGEAKGTRRQGPCRPLRCAPRAVDGAGRCNSG